MQDRSQIAPNIGVVGIEPRRAKIVGESFLGPVQFLQHKRAQVQRGGLVGRKLDAAIEAQQSVLKAPHAMEDMSAPVGGIGMAGVELERLFEAAERIQRIPRREKGIALLPPQLRIAGPELQGLIERNKRIVVPSEVRQREAERREKFRLGILPDGARDPLHRKLGLLRLQMHGAYQMLRVGIFVVERQRLLATGQRFQKPPRQRFFQNGRMQHRQRLRFAGVGFRFCLRRPAFVTVHESFPILAVSDSTRDGKAALRRALPWRAAR